MIKIILILIPPNSRELKIIKPLDNLYIFQGQVVEFVDELVVFESMGWMLYSLLKQTRSIK